MLDELAAEEAHIQVSLLAVVQIAVGAFFRLVVGVESVAGGMRADEAFACLHIIKQCLLAFGGHRRLLVSAFAAQIPGGVEEDGIELV